MHGILRKNSSTTQGIVDLLPESVRKQIIIQYDDINDGHFLAALLEKENPDELYHLTEQSFVGYCFKNAP